MLNSTWLEELVSKSNTIQTQEDISVSGKIAGNTRPKLCIWYWSIRLGPRLAWHEILSVCIRGLRRGHPENPYERAWGGTRSREYDTDDRFHDQRPLDKVKWTFHGPGVCADAQCDTVHGSKNLFQRAILYRHKKIYQCQGRLQAISKRNYVYICDGFSSISQDWSIRFGPRLAWNEILSVCIRGLQRGHPVDRAACRGRA